MRTIGLDQFYKRIEKRIALFGGYTEYPLIKEVIKSCRLKPLSVYSNSFRMRDVILEREWVDEFGDKSVGLFRKAPVVKECSRAIPLISTDIFQNEKPRFIVDHSKYAYIGKYGKSSDFTLLLMGLDNYVRCYTYKDRVFSISSPLNAGLKVLYSFVSNKLDFPMRKLTVKSEIEEMQKMSWFLINLPANKKLINKIRNNKIKEIVFNV